MRYVAFEQFPEGLAEDDVRLDLERLVLAARDLGVRPVEVDVDRATGRAVGIFVAQRETDVREAHDRAGVPVTDVLPVERWWADLVVPPRT